MNIENLENEIQSWVAVQSEHSCQLASDAFVVCANELAEFIKELFKKEKAKLEGCVVVPVELTDSFEEAFSKISKPIIARPYPKDEHGEYIYKEIHEAYLLWQAARGVK